MYQRNPGVVWALRTIRLRNSQYHNIEALFFQVSLGSDLVLGWFCSQADLVMVKTIFRVVGLGRSSSFLQTIKHLIFF
jgi:hypothetical protein